MPQELEDEGWFDPTMTTRFFISGHDGSVSWEFYACARHDHHWFGFERQPGCKGVWGIRSEYDMKYDATLLGTSYCEDLDFVPVKFSQLVKDINDAVRKKGS